MAKLFVAGKYYPQRPASAGSALPTYYLPDENGETQAVTDSTPILRRFETEFDGRSVIPSDPALAFLNWLMEDYGDEWLTKSMFHYRWHYEADIKKGRLDFAALEQYIGQRCRHRVTFKI